MLALRRDHEGLNPITGGERRRWPRARAAAADLDALAATFATEGLKAAAASARGPVQVADGEQAAAVTTLRRCWRRGRAMGAPYEAARARLLLARALSGSGDATAALVELRAAATSFQWLGATGDRDAALALAADLEASPAAAGDRA